MVKYQQIFNFLRKTMKKKRLIFWIFTLIIAAAVCGVINFYFNFENTAKRSCESGNIESCYELGVSYTNGEKVKKDYLKAIPYFEKLCDKNYKSSCYYTAYLYSSDDLPFEKQDYEKSLNIYSSLCANKDFNACIGAGWLYATNRINSQEKFQKAAYCYEIACNEGKRREHCKYIEGLRKDMDVSDTMEHLCDNGNASVCYDMWYAYE